jgi:hypothetical protein
MFDFDVVTGPTGNLPAPKRPARPGIAPPRPAPRRDDGAAWPGEAGTVSSPVIAGTALEGQG